MDVDRRAAVVVGKHVPLLAHILLPDLLLEDCLEGELLRQVIHLAAQPVDVVVLQEDHAAPHGHRALHLDLGPGPDLVRKLLDSPVLHGLNGLLPIRQAEIESSQPV